MTYQEVYLSRFILFLWYVIGTRRVVRNFIVRKNARHANQPKKISQFTR